MDEETREHLRTNARRFFSRAADLMTDIELQKLDELLGVVKRVEAIEDRREAPIWKKPAELTRAIAAAVSIAVVLVSWVWFAATQSATIEGVQSSVNALDSRVTLNRSEIRDEIRNVENRVDRKFEIVDQKLDRVLILLNNENRS